MKQLIVLAMVLLATAAAVFFHTRKIRNIREAPDGVAFSLNGIEDRLRGNQSLNLRIGAGVPSEYFLYARLALAPRHVELIRASDPADTFLLIQSKHQVDSQSASERRIWSAADDAYDYLLLSNQ